MSFKDDLVCGYDNCPSGSPFDHDCCTAIGGCDPILGTVTNSCCTPNNPCHVGEGDCDSDDDCQVSQSFKYRLKSFLKIDISGWIGLWS